MSIAGISNADFEDLIARPKPPEVDAVIIAHCMTIMARSHSFGGGHARTLRLFNRKNPLATRRAGVTSGADAMRPTGGRRGRGSITPSAFSVRRRFSNGKGTGLQTGQIGEVSQASSPAPL